MKWLRACVLAYPAVLPLAFFNTWLAGRVSLGYWPRPSLDDPKYIGPWVSVLHSVTAFLMVVGLPAFVVGVLVLSYQAYRDATHRWSLLRVSGLSVACLVAAILVLRWEPLGIVEWYFD